MIGDSFLAQRLFLSVNWILPEFWIVLSLFGLAPPPCSWIRFIAVDWLDFPRVRGFGLSLCGTCTAPSDWGFPAIWSVLCNHDRLDSGISHPDLGAVDSDSSPNGRYVAGRPRRVQRSEDKPYRSASKRAGGIWIGTDDTARMNTDVIQHGGADRHRTHKNGGVLPARPTGAGDLDLISRLNLDKPAYMARNGIPHDALLTAKFYRFIRKLGEVSPVEQDEAPIAAQQVADVARGSSRCGSVVFYIARIPGPLAIGIPVILLALDVVSRIIGIGLLSPLLAIIRDCWIAIRTVVDVRPIALGLQMVGIGHSSARYYGRCSPRANTSGRPRSLYCLILSLKKRPARRQAVALL